MKLSKNIEFKFNNKIKILDKNTSSIIILFIRGGISYWKKQYNSVIQEINKLIKNYLKITNTYTNTYTNIYTNTYTNIYTNPYITDNLIYWYKYYCYYFNHWKTNKIVCRNDKKYWKNHNICYIHKIKIIDSSICFDVCISNIGTCFDCLYTNF